ncbi:MAG: ribosomal protein [Candidatus Berkelbacteria bacterium]|nr:ribosomal protein [Candidatus Berkelbacteria bacterium]
MENKTKQNRVLKGIALNDSRNNTVKILVDNIKVHPIYKKRFQDSKKYLVSTDQEIHKGQKVIISETKPVSKRKSWKVIKVIESLGK